MNGDGVDAGDIAAVALTNPLILPLVPPAQRAAVGALWALDRRLARLARTGNEPALRQIRLRWWIEQLSKADVATHAEPLLQQAVTLLTPHLPEAALADLAEAWFDSVDAPSASQQQQTGTLLFTNICHLLGHSSADAPAAGRAWAALDHALHASDQSPDWAAIHADLRAVRSRRLPRAFAALLAQARAIASRSGVRSPRVEQISILRAGLFGR